MYRYALTQRPPSIGTQPLGSTDIVDFGQKKIYQGIECWGYVEYSNPLSCGQIEDYELIEISSKN